MTSNLKNHAWWFSCGQQTTLQKRFPLEQCLFQCFPWSNLQLWLLDWPGRLTPNILHEAKSVADSAAEREVHTRCVSEDSRPSRTFRRSNVALPARPILCMSMKLYHRNQHQVAKQSLCQLCCTGSKFQEQALESCILHADRTHKQAPGHRFEKAGYDLLPPKLGRMTFHHLRVECGIAHCYHGHKQQHCRHFVEAHYDPHLQKPGYMKVPQAERECRIVRCHYTRKPQHGHHCREAPYERRLQKLECMKPNHPIVEYYSLHENTLHKQ